METAFPPSPQWHQPHSACLYCISEDAGWFLYSHNSSIHILNPFTLKYQGIMVNGHSGRINSIAARSPINRMWAERANRSEEINNNIDHVPLSSSDGSGSLTQAKVQKEDNRVLLASGGDDMKLVCWDINTRQVFACLKKANQKAIKAVEWTSDGRFVVSGDKGGGMVVWSPFSNQSNRKQLPNKPIISCISASPVHNDTVAIGLEGGDILINQVNLKYIVTLRRLNGHAGVVQSLSWENPSEDHDTGYTLLASGSADQTIRVWDVESESTKNVLTVPDFEKKGGSHYRSGWTPVAWGSRGREIFSCTNRGTMIRCSLDRGAGKFVGITKGKVHNRVVYQVMAWTFGDFAFTISMDRKIIVWDTQSGQGIAHIDCIGGNVHSLDIGLLDPGRVAIGLGNEMIKVWNTLSSEEPFESVMIERLQSKVRFVKWHPNDEEKLCFGLENGKIGIVENILAPLKNHGAQGRKGKQNKNGVSQKQTIFQSYHEGRIVSMKWCTPKVFEAPVPELFDLSLRESSYCIVSCGSEGKILISDSSKPTNKSLDLEVVLQRQNSAWYQSFQAIKGAGAIGRRDFDIHPNEDLIAVGNNDGSVEVYELKYFKLVYAYQGHHKRVNRVKWNWSGVNGGSNSKSIGIQYLLASGSDDGSVAIHRLDRFSEKAIAEKQQQERQVLTESGVTESTPPSSIGSAGAVLPTRRVLAYFSYHTRGISDITWSPHDDNKDGQSDNVQKLVSASFDGKAIVYQVQIEANSQGGGVQTTDIPTPKDISDEQASMSQELENTSTPAVKSCPRCKVIACYAPHEGQVLSVHWSLTDIDRIYSGGNDWRLCCWDWRSHTITEVEMEAIKKEKNNNVDHQSETITVQSKESSAADQESSQMQTTDDDQNLGQKPENSVEVTGSIDQIVDKVIEEVQSDGSIINPGRGGGTQATKRGIEPSIANASPQKRAKNSRTSVLTPTPSNSSLSTTNTTATTPLITASSTPSSSKTLNLFPSSSAAFKFYSKERASLEIIRLARNLFCRRLGHGGTLRSEEDHIAAKERWRAMRSFFEKDNDKDGVRISQILGKDIDEMNLDENEDDMDTGICDDQSSGKPGNNDQVTLEPKGDEEGTITDKTSASGAFDANIDDSASASGDLVFYGSRESIKALAEMEAQEMIKRQSNSAQAQNESNIFAAGNGFGILPTNTHANHRKTTSELRSKKVAQLGQIPITYWMGDVPKMMNILNSLPDSDLGIQDWIGIALSPMGGAEAWKEMMSRTAEKFERRGEVHAASLCYLGIGKVTEAVNVYRKQELYREALMLLRMRLWDDDDEDFEEDNIKQREDGVESSSPKDGYQESKNESSLSSDTNPLSDLQILILTEWGQQLERKGFFEQACKCQLTLAAVLKRNSIRNRENQNNAGVAHMATSIGLQTLARRGDLATLRIVAGLSILLQDPSQNERILRYEAASHKKQPQVGL